MSNAEENPFSALLKDSDCVTGVNKKLIENVFMFTLRRPSLTTSPLLCLADLVVQDGASDEGNMCEELMAHALFERLMITDTQQYLIPAIEVGGESVVDVLETRAMVYLYKIFLNCENSKEHTGELANDCEKIKDLIITNASTCVRQPELFQNQIIYMQLLELMESSDEMNAVFHNFFALTINRVINDVDDIETTAVLKSIFYPLLKEIQKRISNTNMISIKKSVFTVLEYFVSDKNLSPLGEVLIDYTTLNPNAKGGDYMDTLFGQLLSLSIIPKSSNGPYEYFNDISLESQHTNPSLWQFMSMHQNAIFLVIKQLLILSATSKKKTLQWIANCLHANAARSHIWNTLNTNFEQVINQNASDSFMIGLTSVLLRLCKPLCEPTMKVLLVDPTYCAVTDDERQSKNVNMLKADEETSLLPTDEDEKRLTSNSYNFITELFYMTHKAFELGYRVCIERFTRKTRELHNLQTAYQDVANSDPNSDLAKNLLRVLKDQMQQYLCMRNGLMEPENDTLILKFFECSAIWLTETALISNTEFDNLLEKKDFAPHVRHTREIPIKLQHIPAYLKSIPENIIDNIVAYLNFSRHFPPGHFIEMYQSSHDAFFKMIVLFMSSSELVKNPHLRAKLAEALEFLLPKKMANTMRSSLLTHVFENHPDHLQVVRSLLNVFVSIEMTGQSVQFEQKFNYRRPMYAIMEYLWTKEEHVQCFRDLAVEAEHNMEAIDPPLFLRFINLLINDAIFLLDESLSNLQQIRELQEAQSNGEWDSLPLNERQQHLSNLHHLGMLARFDNILGRDTINILKLLTTEIKSIFCHNSMVDRIAAMLNYFLLSLVGPQKEKFKVKDKKEFEFDPAQTVLEICHIYINLSNSERFCLAISQDGRSYSSKLFGYAENILIRIGGGQLIGEMSEFAIKVEKMDAQYKKEQEFISDAPDEYLDPIMSTLMMDPVILPSSNVTVDRTTIARHLLSDQTDPFNREPLTMNKIKPNEVLKAEIEKWIAEKRAVSRGES